MWILMMMWKRLMMVLFCVGGEDLHVRLARGVTYFLAFRRDLG